MKAAKPAFPPEFFHGIAHRGLHDAESTENGLSAFKKAIDAGVAFEFDIHLTKDGELAVVHDSDLKRVTGKDGIVEHLTLKELRDGYRLLDGEKIPTLQEVLDLNNERVPMVIELKVYERNYKPLAKKAMEGFEAIKDPSKAIIISFDPRAILPFRKSRFNTSLLVCESHLWTIMFRNRFDSIDVELTILDDRRVLSYAKKKPVNVWTIESEEDLMKCAAASTVTFQHISPEKVREYLSDK
jgi:glycerophosphoryl diester phosphodiesterase